MRWGAWGRAWGGVESETEVARWGHGPLSWVQPGEGCEPLWEVLPVSRGHTHYGTEALAHPGRGNCLTVGFPKLEQEVQDVPKFQPPSPPLPPRAMLVNGPNTGKWRPSKAETLRPKMRAELWSAAEHANMCVSRSQGVIDINQQLQQGQSPMTETAARLSKDLSQSVGEPASHNPYPPICQMPSQRGKEEEALRS